MNYDEIEGLSESQLIELYEDTLNTDNDFISVWGTIYYVTCDNGRKGFSIKESSYNNIGTNGTSTSEMTSKVCGDGQRGDWIVYGHFNTNGSKTTGTLFYVQCQNGITGYYPKNGYLHSIGFVARDYSDTTLMKTVCGAGNIGTATAYAHFDS